MGTIDTSAIALDDLIEQESPTRLGKASGNGTKRTRKGSCPWCGGTDRFAVLVADEPQHFYCGIHGGQGCGKHGDAITFIREWKNLPFVDAVKYLGLELPPRDGSYSGYTPAPKKERPLEINLDVPPPDVWAMAALSFARTCQKILWGEHGKPAMDWLKRRGLTEATIRERGYGYNPTEQFIDIAEWGVTEGKKVWLPRGIVIPWMIGDTIWKISIRRSDTDLKRDAAQGKKPSKYVPVKGGSNAIYRADTIRPGQPLILFEGEFNADILAQILAEAGITDIAVIATGSTGKGRADNWLVKIAKASPILISFDPDGAGAAAAKEHWLKVLPQALLWPCIGGDMNDMYLAGKDVVKWLKRGLKLAGSSVIPVSYQPSHQETAEPTPIRLSDTLPPCSVCGRNDANGAPFEAEFYFEDDGNGNGVFFCADCWQRRQSPTVTYTPDPEQESPPTAEEVLAHIERIDAIRALVQGEIDGPIFLREVPPSWSQDEWMKDVAREYEAMYRRGEQAKARRFLELISQHTRVKAS